MSNFTLNEIQRKLCLHVLNHLKSDLAWPNSRKLHIELRELGDIWEIKKDVDWQLLIVDDPHKKDGIAKISIYAIWLCNSDDEYLDHFIKAIKYFVSEYISTHGDAKITSTQIKNCLNINGAQTKVLCELIHGEYSLHNGGTYNRDSGEYSFDISPNILDYEKMTTIEEYISIQDNLLPRQGVFLADPYNSNLKSKSDSRATIPEGLEVGIFNLIKQEDLKEIMAQDLNELRIAFDNQLWKTVCILCGSLCEGILSSCLEQTTRIDNTNNQKLNTSLSQLIELAIKKGIIEKRARGLLDYLRDARNLIHPLKARKGGQVTKEMATVSYNLFLLICDVIVKLNRD